MGLKFSPTRHPGSNYVYVICDVCGKKVRRKDTVLVKDKWNYQNNLLVCKWDVDRTNPQSIPVKIKEKIIDHTELLRPEIAETYLTPDNDNRVPSAPTIINIYNDPLSTALIIQWEGPTDCGSSGIIDYIIKRAHPQLHIHYSIESDTNVGTAYTDTTADPSLEYTYIVAATNTAGTGSYSAPFFWPVQRVNSSTDYLLVSQDDTVLTTGDGDPIVLSY